MNRKPAETPSENLEASPPIPPEELKPWYYQYWFLYPTIIFWPLWSVLILRSPWHNGLVSGALAWAMLFVGGYLVYQGTGGTEFLARLQSGSVTIRLTLQFILPGLLLVLITQIHWQRNRRRILNAAKEQDFAGGSGVVAAAGRVSPSAGGQSRRRRSRRRRR